MMMRKRTTAKMRKRTTANDDDDENDDVDFSFVAKSGMKVVSHEFYPWRRSFRYALLPCQLVPRVLSAAKVLGVGPYWAMYAFMAC